MEFEETGCGAECEVELLAHAHQTPSTALLWVKSVALVSRRTTLGLPLCPNSGRKIGRRVTAAMYQLRTSL
jgi:predicted TIM-barrel enzyme